MNQNALVVQGLAKTYDGFALKDVSFRVPSGAIVGLIGENGAGKTTTLHAILGLIDRDAGDIEILGERDAPCAILSAARSAWSSMETIFPTRSRRAG